MSTDPRSAPTAGGARAALSALEADATQLAERLVTPWWYHVLVGALVALAIGSLAIPRVHPAAVVPVLVIWTPFLLNAFTRRYGIAVPQPAGRRSRRALLLCLTVLGSLVAVAVVLAISSPAPWLVLLPAAASFGATIMLGRRYDAVLRSEVALQEVTR